MADVADHAFEAGSKTPPVFRSSVLLCPPQTIIRLPVHTTVLLVRPAGALVVLVGSQTSESGSYRPPVLVCVPPARPPQTIIREPVHTAT